MSSQKPGESTQIINFVKAREAKVEEKRRTYERILFKNILGVYCVAEGEGLKAIELVDVSEEGMSFQLPAESKNLSAVEEGKEVVFRFYFSQETFIPVAAKVTNSRSCIENGKSYVRFGCSIDKSAKSFGAYKTFVQFLSQYAEVASEDKGDLKIFFF